MIIVRPAEKSAMNEAGKMDTNTDEIDLLCCSYSYEAYSLEDFSLDDLSLEDSLEDVYNEMGDAREVFSIDRKLQILPQSKPPAHL